MQMLFGLHAWHIAKAMLPTEFSPGLFFTLSLNIIGILIKPFFSSGYLNETTFITIFRIYILQALFIDLSL